MTDNPREYALRPNRALCASDPPRLGLSTDEKIAAARVEKKAWMLDTIRPLIGCTCEAHYSTGESASCERWRQKTAERIADALLSASGDSGVQS